MAGKGKKGGGKLGALPVMFAKKPVKGATLYTVTLAGYTYYYKVPHGATAKSVLGMLTAVKPTALAA